MERAFAQAAQLPEDKQNTIATLLLEEMEIEQKWDELFAGSQDLLAQLADEALTEHRAGETKPMDLDAV